MFFYFQKKITLCVVFIITLCACNTLTTAGSDKVANKSSYYIKTALGVNQVPKAQIVWVTKKLRPLLQKILKNRPPALRYRYWQKDGKTVWIMNEIGKTLPITMAITIENNKVLDMSVLKYRESHGAEIKYSAFRDQFFQASVKKNTRLNKRINGISGATLSVNASKRMVRITLLLHKAALKDHDTSD